MILAIATLCCTATFAPVDDVAAFRTAFRERQPYSETGRPDPAISKCLNILTGAVKKKWIASTPEEAPSLPEFVEAAKKAGGQSDELTDFGCIAVRCREDGGVRWIVISMGQVSRTSAYTVKWNPIALPKQFDWNYPWDVEPNRMPSGMWAMYSTAIQHGSKVGVKLVFLKQNGAKFDLVGSFQSESILEQLDPKWEGNKVTLQTSDQPMSFSVYRGSTMLGRETTWDCSGDKPKVVKKVLKDQELRAVDQFLAAAKAAKKPTPEQKLIKSVWKYEDMNDPNDEKDLLTKLPNGNTAVSLGPLVFEVKPETGGLAVVGVRARKST